MSEHGCPRDILHRERCKELGYDPDPKRRKTKRKGKVPPQLRAWVYRGKRKGDPDPARRRTHRRKYDPDPARRKTRKRLSGFMGFLDKWSYGIGGLAGFFLPKFSDLQQYYVENPDPNYQGLWGAIKAYFQWNFIKDMTQPKVDKAVDKLTNPASHHGTFFGTFIAGIVLAVIGILPIPSKWLPRPAKSVMGKLGASLAVGTALGAMFSHWESPPSTQTKVQTNKTTTTPTSTSTSTSTSASVLSYYG